MTGSVVVRASEAYFLVAEQPQTFVRRVIQLNDASALQEFGQIALEFVPEYQTLALNTLSVLRNGKPIDKRDTAAVRFLQRESGLEQSIYSGVVTASILVDDLRVGDLVEIAYTTTGANPVFGTKYFDAAGWAQRHPTELRRVILQYPSGRDIRYRYIGQHDAIDMPEPSRSRVGGMTRLTFENRRVAATIPEADAPAGHDAWAWIQFSEYGSWAEVADWAAGLFADGAPFNTELSQQLASIESSATTEQKIVKALTFVQDEVRYFSVSLGESSHRPSPPNATIERRFGDCKDKSLLLTAMLRRMGIKADPVLVSLQRFRNLQSLLPSPAVFDHVIVRVEADGNEYYLDPTRIGQTGRLETIAQHLVGAEVLVAAAGTTTLSEIGNTKTLASLPNSILNETISLPDFGKPATLDVRFSLNGKDAEIVRLLRQRVREHFEKMLLADVTRRYPGAQRIGEIVYTDKPEENHLEILERYTIDKAAETRPGGWVIRFAPANMISALQNPTSLDRKAPMAIPSFPHYSKYSFEVTLPEEVSAVRDPRSKEVRNKYFALNLAERFRGNVSRIDLELRTLAAAVPPQDLKSFANDLRETNDQIRGYVWIPENLIKSKTLFESADDAFVRKMRTNAEEEVAIVTKSIESGKLTGKDLAMAYMERGTANSVLGHLPAALADMREAIKLDSLNPAYRADAAMVHLRRGEYQNSLEQFNKALSLGLAPETVYYRRGQTYRFMGRHDEALQDFGRVALAPEQSDSKPYATLWYLWTLGQTGKPVPEELRAELDRNLEGNWPRPAHGLFTGAHTPEKLLEIVNRMQGSERLLTLCEAYFYIGQYYLVKQDIAKAREYFEKTRATQVILYTEHAVAEIELERLARK